MAGNTEPTALPKPKLLDHVRQAIRVRHYSLRTEQAYVAWIKRFIFFHGKRHPLEMGGPEVNQFLTDLAVSKKVSASTQNQALSALLFLYRHVLNKPLLRLEELVRAKKPKRLPVVMTKPEVKAVLSHLEGTPRLVGMLLYGTGMRLMECLRLRVKDFELNQIVIRDGKGQKDRVTMLPVTVKERRHEGVSGGHYARKMVCVRVDSGDELEAVTYVAGDAFIDDSLTPCPAYLQTILRGAREHDLPEEYIRGIEALGRRNNV